LLALGAVAACLTLAGLVGGGAYLLAKDDGGEAGSLDEQSLAPWEDAGATWEAAEADPPTLSEPPTEAPPPEPQPEFEEAREAFLAHWQAIADGRYGEAYDLFHPGYEAERSGWIETHESEATLVNMGGVTVEPGTTDAHEDEYWLYVEVPLRDSGGAYAGDCRVFFGEVRMALDVGDLLYRPGVYRGREGTFGRSDLGGGVRELPESDSRCP
jgi:hypothetical protein